MAVIRNKRNNRYAISKFRKFGAFKIAVKKTNSGPTKRSQTNFKFLQELRNKAYKAKRENKTFMIFGSFPMIRSSLEKREWVEKCWSDRMQNKDLTKLEDIQKKSCSVCKRRVLSRFLGLDDKVNFIWHYQRNIPNTLACISSDTVCSRYPREYTRYFTSKSGLCDTLRNINYKNYCGRQNKVLCPRTYNLARTNEIEAFLFDYRHTAAISLLNYIVTSSKTHKKLYCSDYKIFQKAFEFAVHACYDFVRHIKRSTYVPFMSNQADWEVFLQRYYSVVTQKYCLKEVPQNAYQGMVNESKKVLKHIKHVWPYLNTDGVLNLWLIKPKSGCMGRGIAIKRSLSSINQVLKSHERDRFVLQKYIERPLLIKGTKFDIRQWFLVTTIPFLKVWMYKVYYLRFSSQLFNLHKSNEEIHLTNNAVQCRYENCARSYLLPEENMWDSDQFSRYLRNINQKPRFHYIYEQMRRSIREIFNTEYCHLRLIKNRFELFGADFLVDESFHTHLLEINCRPALKHSTSVTARMVPQLLEDIVKVTVDYARNNNMSTGNFELILTD